MNRIKPLKNAVMLFTFLLIFWGFYRLIFRFPDWVEELIIKPVVWIVPVLYLVRREKQNLASIGITFKNLFPAVYSSLALGSLFAIEAFVTNYIKYGGKFNFGANLGPGNMLVTLGLSFGTAISEEIVFRGYIFSRMETALNSEWNANLVTSIGWTLIHVPITIFVNKLSPPAAIIYLFLTFIFGIGSTFIYARTRNISSSILLHVLWEWPITLFR